MRLSLLGLIAATFVAAPALAARQTPEQQLERMLAGRTAGKPVDCISRMPTTRSTTIPHIGTTYEMGGTLYVNRFEGGCPQLDDTRILVTRTPGTQLCRGDMADVVTQPPVVPIGTCIYDRFTPYKRIK